MLPGILVGAALGGVVGLVTLLVPSPFDPNGSAPGATATTKASGTEAAPPAATPTTSASAAGSSASTAGVADDGEADYLRRAHQLVSSDPAQSLAMTEAFPTRFPNGRLGQEREIVAIEALLALGRAPEARARAKLFLTLFPRSAHRKRLEMLVPGLSAEGKDPEP